MKRIFIISLVLFSTAFLSPLFSLTHTVVQGETFYGISRKYGISVKELLSANKLSEKDILKPGQKLSIPSKTASSKPSEMKVVSYTVQKGETLYSISKKFGTSVETLQAMNAMSGNDIKVDQVISVPMAVTSSVASSSQGKTSSQNTPKPSTQEKSTSVTVVQTSSDELEQLEDLRMTDSRTYDKSKTANKNLKWPVSPKEIQYVTGKVSGVAITTNDNETVKSLTEGSVMFCGVYRGFGNVVFVQNNSGMMYVYSNLSKISVKEGDSVTANQKIGNVAVDTRCGKPQLMFMVFKGADPIDPGKAPRV